MTKRIEFLEREQSVLEYLINATKAKGYPPSIREICTALNIKSVSTVHIHLENLERAGFISRSKSKTRAIDLSPTLGMAETMLEVPVLGTIAAGQPILAEETHGETIKLPEQMMPLHGDHFVLRVRGQSMVEAGILEDDYVVVHRQNTARNGDIIVALIENEATLKRFYAEKNGYRLQPENSTMEPIFVKDLSILGKVTATYRLLAP